MQIEVRIRFGIRARIALGTELTFWIGLGLSSSIPHFSAFHITHILCALSFLNFITYQCIETI